MSKPADKPKQDEVLVEFYQKREKIYPRQVTGIFATLRWAAVLALLGLYYVVPWIEWGGRQGVLFDLPNRKFYIFSATFWPQDFFYLAALLIIAALALFFFTAVAGRLWCGYACPQTVWTEAFMWIERQFEGNRMKQMKLDKAPWNAERVLRKGGKQVVWILFSIWTGLTFVGYFTPIRELVPSFLVLNTGPWETFWVLFYGFATYGNAGWMREQVCIYMCPYARFQSAMFDKDTLVISYDTARGEPRGARKRSVDPKQASLGDCIDCTMCVQVCPTGIDIRDGLQYQCIGCAACIDVCDEVMEKMGYPKGLVRYTTEHALEGGDTKLLRGRTMLYATMLLAITVALFTAIATRVPLELGVIRDRNALYRETGEGLLENVYTLKIINKDEVPHRYSVSVTGLEGMKLSGADDVSIPSGEVRDLVVSIAVDPEHVPAATNTIYFKVEALENPKIAKAETVRFLGPVRR
ncbi:MAG: cytochrome c oxidase accessory protein CcoG [Thiotrichales bacterium]